MGRPEEHAVVYLDGEIINAAEGRIEIPMPIAFLPEGTPLVWRVAGRRLASGEISKDGDGRPSVRNLVWHWEEFLRGL